MLAHIAACESAVVVVLGLDGTTFHESTGAVECRVGCHQCPAPGELGNSGAGRIMFITRGGGGSNGMNNPIIALLTSSLLPHRSSPAPSSSRPSNASALVR